MNNLTVKYELAKKKATDFMSKGDITNYLESLLEVNHYKNIMTSIIAN